MQGKRMKTDSRNGKQPFRKKVPSEQTGGSAWGKKIWAWFAGQMQKIDVKKMVVLNIPSALFGVAAYTVLLCFSLMKTGSLSKSIFNAH